MNPTLSCPRALRSLPALFLSLVALGLGQPAANAATVTNTYNLGSVGSGTTIPVGVDGLLPWIVKGTLPTGSLLRSVSVNARLDVQAGDSWASDICAYLDPTPTAPGTEALLQVGGYGEIGTVAQKLDWDNGQDGTVGATVIDKKTAGVDFPTGIDLDGLQVSVGNDYDPSTWSGTITVEYYDVKPATILTFGLPSNLVYNYQFIGGTNIAWTVPYGTDVTNLAPLYTLSSGTCDRESGSTNNFTTPLRYTVWDLSVTNVYTVTVTVTPANTTANIVSFNYDGVIAAHNITWVAPYGSDIANLAPIYKMSPFAKGTPASGSTVNFSSPAPYTIVSESLTTTNVYTVTATLSTDPNLALIGHWVSGEENLSDTSGFTPAGTHDGVAEGGNASLLGYSGDVPAGLTGSSLDLTAGGFGAVGVMINNSAVGDSGYVNTFDDPILGGFTVCFWAKGFPEVDWCPWVSKHGEDNEGWQVRRRANSHTPTFTIRNTAGDDDPTVAVVIDNTTWHHYAGTFNGVAGARKLYVDGVEYLWMKTDTGTVGNPNNSHLELGARDGDNYFNGLLYDVRMYNRALYYSEIRDVIDVPEPAAAVLLGLLALAAIRRR